MTTPNLQRLASLAKDLTKDYPRSPRDLLAGYIIGARTLERGEKVAPFRSRESASNDPSVRSNDDRWGPGGLRSLAAAVRR